MLRLHRSEHWRQRAGDGRLAVTIQEEIEDERGAIVVPAARAFGAGARATLACVAVAALIVVEVALGVAVYRDIGDVDLAIFVACGGVVGFAAVDVWLRPRTEGRGAERLRRFMPAWSVVPFLCALGSSAWVHHQQRQHALCDVRMLATELNRPLPAARGGRLVMQPLDKRLDAVSRSFLIQLADEKEKTRFIKLARVVARDLDRANGDIDKVLDEARQDTLVDFCMCLGLQALFVLWIPFLLMTSIARAGRKLASRHQDRGRDQTQAADRRAARCLRRCLDVRDRRILSEERAFFVPRLCFGALLVLGTAYVFAPFGLRASYLMSLVNDHPAPGQTSYVLWCNNFSAVPVLVVGFVGFLLYALMTATQRFAQDDFDDQAMFALLIRGLVVILLSFALSPVNDDAARLFVFVAGVFPLRALEALAKRANISLDPDFPSDGPGSFDGISSLDPTKVFALRAAGIQSTYDLAAMPIEEVARRVRIDPRLLGRAVDRAILVDSIGPDLTKALEPFAITSATELAKAKDSMSAIRDKLGEAPQRAAERLASDRRLTLVQEWLEDAQAEAERANPRSSCA
jgi:hypothetical protein